jgi:hypothetical protein
MFANIFGTEGVEKVIELMKREIAVNAGNLGLNDLKKITADSVKWTPRGYSG